MKITWLGHAAFLIETQGVNVILDPYSSRIGYAPIDLSADIVTVSHDNPKYHSCLDELREVGEVVRGLELQGAIERHGIKIGAVQVYENEAGDGPNAMVWLESEGLRVLHMGDVGHRITPEQIATCGRVDVLLALAGGSPTIEMAPLYEFIEALQPRIVIPMHFGVPHLDFKLQPVEEFLVGFSPEQIQQSESSTLEVSRETLPQELAVCLLAHAR